MKVRGTPDGQDETKAGVKFTLTDEQTDAAGLVLAPLWGNVQEAQLPPHTAALMKAVSAKKAPKGERPLPAGPKEEQVLPKKEVSAGQTKVTEEAPGEDSEAEGEEVEKTDAQEEVRFKQGDVVITSATKNKESYDNRRGRIARILKHHYNIELLEGPSKGESRRYLHGCVKAAPQGPPVPGRAGPFAFFGTGRSATATTNPAADSGAKRSAGAVPSASAADQADPDIEAKRRLLHELKALELFGDVSLATG